MIFEIEEVLQLQELLIDEFGGIKGLRDFSLLESALVRPLQEFDGNPLYPSRIDQAAALLESMVVNHPFLDGNKQIGYFLMRLFLLNHELDINATQDEKYNLVIGVASARLKFEDIKNWLIARVQ